ncbi:Blue copper oxidase CueO [Jannaschia pagri]|uniref:Blue copper oxidase CueO n=1 Tax=Jannaschia pagri TaxID=2829797 RepID=A0ABQ4NRH0_9RHOB|nr:MULTISPECIES: multicopper oxidase domain-containing protein [unclassified Jannaschia]GIT93222.1 Blue copper oxidase CueO [Jannaschia sp. AI_61]GIT97011.1 Blue copper oxidase CueO [Jannaschia sp. AI_62]
MNRRQFCGGAAALGLGTATLTQAQSSLRPLPIPPLMDLRPGVDKRIPLVLAPGRHDFGTGTLSETFGIGAPYLGPVIRASSGQTLPFDVSNGIGEVTTLHWHGLHIPGDVDGGPHQEIEPGEMWSPDVPLAQRAATTWFHSHTHGRTARQTYKGLAGVLIVEDEDSRSADLPQTYGVDDFTLILQDRAFDGTGQLTYMLSAEVFEDGFEGETLTVNGTLAPVGRAVPRGLVRLRLLNACNARFLTLSMAAGPLHVIASDGGFLTRTVETETILMSPGERYEVLVDMGSTEENSLLVRFGADAGIMARLGGLFGGGGPMTALTLTRTAEAGTIATMPDRLAALDPPDPSAATVTRNFTLEMETGADLAALAMAWDNFCGDAGAMAINGMPMNMDRIDEEARLGDTEIWRISVDDMLHPFHIHGCSFRILTQNGGPPPAYAAGWKDMVHVEDGWSEVLVRFDHPAPAQAPYMYHCHILEHEDCGMMGQFTVS